MAKSSIIGQLRVILGLDTAQFEKGLDDSQRQLIRAGKSFEQIGRRIEGVGKSLSIGLTLPIVAIGGAALKMASSFEAGMNRVEAATGASGAQLKALRDQAKAFGADRSVTATAAQVADVMEALAKNGLSATQILNGATAAVLKLSAANGAEFAPSADLVTDIMQQFGKQTGDLDGVVDKLTGGMLVSKFGFDDYRQAIGQTGGVAGGLGLSFEEVNTALAATSALFASGSDAGTSFKTFLTSLAPQSKQAAEMMKKLGLDFFDTQGKMKSLSAIAQLLKDRLGGLSDKAKNNALKTIFGTDAMRTAIALMNQGAAGLGRINEEVNKASAQDQMTARMKGWSGALVQVQKAFESAAIAMGDSGFLSALTNVAVGVADLIRWFAQLPTSVLQTIGIFFGVAAAIGPVIFMVGKLVGVWGTLIQLGPRLVVSFGTIVAGEAAVGTGALSAASAMATLRAAMAFLTGPWGLVIGGIAAVIGVLAQRTDEVGPATREADKALAALVASHRAATPAIDKMAASTSVATDKMEEAIVKAKALATALYGVAAGFKAAALERAKQRLTEAKAEQARVGEGDARSPFARMMGVKKGATRADQANNRAADDKTKRAARLVDFAQRDFDTARIDSVAADIHQRFGPKGPKPLATSNPDLSPFNEKEKKSHGPSAEELARRREEIRLEVEIQAAEDLGDTARAQGLRDQLDLQKRIKDYEQAGLKTEAARAAAAADMKTLVAARAEATRREIEQDQRSLDIENASIVGNGVLQDSLERQAYLAERVTFWREKLPTLEMATAAAMADQAKHEAAIATARASQAAAAEAQRQIALAQSRGDSEEKIRALQQAEDIRRRTEELQRGADGRAPMDEATAKAQAMSEAMQSEQARQTGIFRDTIKGGFRAALDGNFGSWFSSWWKDRVARGMEDALNSLADLIASLFSQIGKGSSGGGGGGGIFGAIGSALGGIFGGGSKLPSLGANPPGPMSAAAKSAAAFSLPGFKTGGSFEVGGRSGIDSNLVQFRATKGELVNITKGEDAGAPGSQPSVVRLVMEEGAMFEPRVTDISGGVSVETVSRAGRSMKRSQRQKLA